MKDIDHDDYEAFEKAMTELYSDIPYISPEESINMKPIDLIIKAPCCNN